MASRAHKRNTSSIALATIESKWNWAKLFHSLRLAAWLNGGVTCDAVSNWFQFASFQLKKWKINKRKKSSVKSTHRPNRRRIQIALNSRCHRSSHNKNLLNAVLNNNILLLFSFCCMYDLVCYVPIYRAATCIVYTYMCVCVRVWVWEQPWCTFI